MGAFARHLMRVAAVGEEVTNHVTSEAAKIVRDNAKGRIGDYQDHVGPFKAWAPLAESTKADRVAKGYPEDEPLLREGVLRDSIEADSRGNTALVGSAGRSVAVSGVRYGKDSCAASCWAGALRQQERYQ